MAKPPVVSTPKIERFEGRWHFLSNFYTQPFEFRGVLYPTSEHAYQDAKTRHPVTNRVVDQAAHDAIMASLDPGVAKKAGQTAKIAVKEWNARKNAVMLAILRAKFAPGTFLAQRLLATKQVQLVEGNFWGDRYWGVFRGVGQNHLGRLLMQVREELDQGNIFN